MIVTISYLMAYQRESADFMRHDYFLESRVINHKPNIYNNK